MLTPCDPSDPHAMAMNWRQMDSTKVLALPVLVQDYFDVLKKIKPLVSNEDVRRCKEWTDEYDSEGAKV